MNEPDHQQHELGPEPAPADLAAGHELSDVSIGGLVTFLAGLVISLAVVVIAVAGLFVWLMRQADRADPPQPPLAELRAKQPPAPRLQESPAREMRHLAAEQAALLKHTTWIDKERKIVQIPIERAMDMVAKRGLPDWPRVEVDAKQSPSDGKSKASSAKENSDNGADARPQESPRSEKPADDKL
jgi:hypothetical protein